MSTLAEQIVSAVLAEADGILDGSVSLQELWATVDKTLLNHIGGPVKALEVRR